MYGIVLLVALCAGEESAHSGKKKTYPHPIYDGGGNPGYHNHGGWGLPYGGYGWPGYGCPDYWHIRPMVTLPPEPLVVPPPGARLAEDEDDEDEPPARKNGDRKNGGKKNGDDKDEIDDVPSGVVGVQKLGLRVADLTPPRRRYLGYGSDVTGVAVSAVAPKGFADRDGLREGMVIVSIDGVAVTTARQAADALDRAKAGVRVQVVNPLGERKTITLGE
jgi:hypothetical protein